MVLVFHPTVAAGLISSDTKQSRVRTKNPEQGRTHGLELPQNRHEPPGSISAGETGGDISSSREAGLSALAWGIC